MKLLIATPAFNGFLTTEYFNAFIQTLGPLAENGIQVSVITAERDGLISRARNRCAMVALQGGADKILFIDSDIVWKPKDVVELTRSNLPVIGGTYPYRELPLKLCFVSLDNDRSKQEPVNFFKMPTGSYGEVEVKYVPTGFLLIDMEVFRAIMPRAKKYFQYDPFTKETHEVYDFFPIQINNEKYDAEDWGFCNLARDAGYKIHLNTRVVVDHIGQYRFSVKQ